MLSFVSLRLHYEMLYRPKSPSACQQTSESKRTNVAQFIMVVVAVNVQ